MLSDLCVRLGKRIRRLRQKRGWQQVDLAAHAETSRQHISAIELGQRELCILTLERIAVALDLTPSELLREAEASQRR